MANDVIDISAWQEYPDWGYFASSIDGVIIKIGEGKSLDEKFIEHVNNAVSHGVPYGVYYYGHATTIEEARQEANTVNDWLVTYLRGETPQLGIWYDTEAPEMLNGANNVAYLAANFVARLYEIGHTYVGIYANYDWLTNHYDLSVIPQYVPFWVAQYSDSNDFAKEHPERIVRIWQFTNCRLINGTVYDSNLYYGQI